MTTPTMKIDMRIVSSQPVSSEPGLCVSGRKMSRIESTPAVRVMTPTNAMGTAVRSA
jgi:hypothetical protein